MHLVTTLCAILLLCSRQSYQNPQKRQASNNSADENFIFTAAEVTTTLKLSDMEVNVEAFKNKENDNIIKEIESHPLKSGALRFMSIGYPQLILSPHVDHGGSKRSAIPYFVLTASGFTMSIRMLTDPIRDALASAASKQYQAKIDSDQILMLIPTSLTCDVEITTKNNSYSLHGKSPAFNTNPFKVDFKVPVGSAERSLLESFSLTSDMLEITCEVIKRAQRAQTDTLIISSSQLDKLDLQNKLVGPGGKSFVSRHQMNELAREIQQNLNIQENYETSGGFDESFVRDMLDNFGGKEAFQPQPIQEVLKNLSPYKLDADLKPNEIYKELSSVLKIEGSGSKQHIVAANESSDSGKESSSNSGKASVGGSGWGVSVSASAEAAKANSNEWASGRKSLDDQLKELNSNSQSDVKWEQQGNTIVPKSLDVMQISSAQLSKSLVFSRVRQKLTAADYRKEFILELEEAVELMKTTTTVTTKTTLTTLTTTTKTTATTPTTTTNTTNSCDPNSYMKLCDSDADCCSYHMEDFNMEVRCFKRRCRCSAYGYTLGANKQIAPCCSGLKPTETGEMSLACPTVDRNQMCLVGHGQFGCIPPLRCVFKGVFGPYSSAPDGFGSCQPN